LPIDGSSIDPPSRPHDLSVLLLASAIAVVIALATLAFLGAASERSKRRPARTSRLAVTTS
jgi:hypothetical protein